MQANALHDLTAADERAALLLHDVFSTMLDSDAWPDERADAEARHPILGAVYFAGAARGAVHVGFDAAVAYRIAERLMGAPAPAAIDDDVRDAVAEVTNMIAGNLKAMLAGETAMSAPSVIEGTDVAVRVAGAERVRRMAFATPDGGFVVSLIEMPAG